MLLFNPSPGQITDRLHILMLKCRAARERGVDFLALDKEAQACQDAIAQCTYRKDFDEDAFSKFALLSGLLYKQNESQWCAEDEIHSAIKNLSADASYKELLVVVGLAKTTHLGNECRASLVAEIDELFGETADRKMYR